MLLKPDMMRSFRAVAREGTLAAAAATLGRTPSAISMTLSQFETEVGAPLFAGERKNRLTPLGLRVLEECERALDAIDRSTEAITRHARSTAGTVRIAAVPSAAMTVLPSAIAGFRGSRPDVRLEIADVDSAAVLRRLRFDEADIGIASAGAPDQPLRTELVAETLFADRLGIVCRADSPILTGALSWSRLADEPLIVNPLCDLIDHPTARTMIRGSTLTARNTMTLLSFVRSGLGATVLPRRVLADRSREISFVAPSDPAAERSLLVLTHRDRPPSPASAAFIDALRALSEDEDRAFRRKFAGPY
ncbi:HTH-type transcriptional regulator CynR [Defluviimonas aquaemixtae]|uniref:HTH-type transcriptional regulator CynR n=1 Tax=Albidovulum aquaemixtae TaxID=1542388 RepID=A0A2R8B2E5_9RHOB|nr:LysR substrate-binding domain-containing protein [Defluviimonas aquaemixtae]SPH16804.1 HTH-type transcriptional regulator CynR [Defluviimonas aquaemixtae]